MSEAAPRMPSELGRFRIQESEGLIVFSEDEPVWSQHCRFSFQRKASCWYLSIEGQTNDVSVADVIRAFDKIREVYGGNFEGKNGENRP